MKPCARQQPPPERAFPLDRHVHGGMAFHRPRDSPLGLLAGGVDEPGAHEQPEQDGEHHDHQRAADELGGGELPAHQQSQDDAQLDHQVGRTDLERHRGHEVGALAEQRPGQTPPPRTSTTTTPLPTRPPAPGCAAGRRPAGPRSSSGAPRPAPLPTGQSRGSRPRGFPRSSTRPAPRRVQPLPAPSRDSSRPDAAGPRRPVGQLIPHGGMSQASGGLVARCP